MLDLFKKYQWVCLAILIYLIGISCYAFANYKFQSKALYAEIDTRLLKVVNGSLNVLNNELGVNIRGEEYIPYKEEKELALKLQEIVDLYKIAYVYTLIEEEGELLFISSNPTPEELSLEAEYEVTYKTSYEEVDPPLRKAFTSKTIQYGESKDQWGHFRSVYYPYVNSNDEVFVVGADAHMSEVHKELNETVKNVYQIGAFLLLIGLPLLLVAARNRYKANQTYDKYIYTNNVTGLKNKLKLTEELRVRKRRNLTLVRIQNYDDIVRLKGQLIADQVVKQFSNRLITYQYPGLDIEVFHVQENVFALHLINELPDINFVDAGHVLFNLLVQFDYGSNDGANIRLNVHIGGVSTEEDALVLANMALYEAAEKNLKMVRYSEESDWPKHYSEELLNHKILVESIKNRNLIAYYQPIFEINSKKVTRYEALARIVDDNDEIVLEPDKFIPLANRSRLSHKVTKVMLTNVIKKIRGTDVKVSINISAHDLEDFRTSEYIYWTIRRSNLGKQISLEILEDQKITDYHKIKKSLSKIRTLGCGIGLDDLGKHYSNLDRLLQLPLDFIKIDGGIISQLTGNKDVVNLLNEIVHFAKDRGLKTTAEFCSSEEIYHAVKSLGIDEVQGFYLGKPSEEFLV